MNQFSFDFEGDGTAASQDAAPARPAAPRKFLTLEEMAQRLEQDADFRVLRRLVPRSDFGPAPVATDGAQTTPGFQRVLVLDTETTGLSHQADKIIELAMLLVSVDLSTGLPFGPVTLFEGFEDPGMPIPAIAKEVTGISDDMVQGHRLDDAQVQAVVDQADLIVAHNAGFDRPFLEARFPFFSRKHWACSFADIDWKAAGAESSKLSALAQNHGWFYDAHRAQVDCHALLQVLAKPMVSTAPTTGLSQLMAVAAKPSFKLRAIGSPFESKDLLKGRGYRWDGDGKVWFCTLTDQEHLDTELAWLKSDVYGRRQARVEIEALDSLVRYSARPGTVTQQGL
ncbi:3'-5' exonuclease [Hydrogenophaga sp.]|uniref:3'-5' exonuclease n=1 Tax=Hydrogenophaga sp. TaxID=1904254 RepID=UPI0027188004|nr:3'-5' exonuclease [Hydrogenophaga sp.]MDO9437668.1 3'-5' exonuclease [Hydrogenophaga sp.]